MKNFINTALKILMYIISITLIYYGFSSFKQKYDSYDPPQRIEVKNTAPKKAIQEKKDTVEIYPGRHTTKPGSTKYNLLALPQNRLWLTSSEWKGQHIKTELNNCPILKARFKAWKKIHIETFIDWIGKEAQKEYSLKKFNSIPACLVIAQAIIESNFGLSRLAASNNLFGHKHRKNRKFTKGFTIAKDDSDKDRFSNYISKWHSLRSHSYLLLKYGKRIKGKPSLQKWLRALCGGLTIQQSKKHVENGGTVYATSCYKGTCYADKLKAVIKKYNLKRFD